MKFSVQNDPDWLSRCLIKPVGENFVAHPAAFPIGTLVEKDHPLHAKIKAEYERRQEIKKK
jgi:hypothetical protein